MLIYPRYAEFLENSQHALIAAVRKLYTMVRNGESWELGDPEINYRGEPTIHDIVSKLGCIQPWQPDRLYTFPEGAEVFAELQAQLQAAQAEMGSEKLDCIERASRSESDHWSLSKHCNQMIASTIKPTFDEEA